MDYIGNLMEIKVNGQTIRLEVLPIHEIRPYENNIRIHPVAQLEALANSFNEFGLKNVIVVDKNNVIVAGHARYEVAAAVGMQELLCIVADDLNDEQITAFRIVDNEIAEQGATDVKALQMELTKISNIEMKKFNTNIKPLKLDMSEPKERELKDSKLITCPRCRYEFMQEGV
jgi:ParB-like chromosome segregation protein Spo0J